MSVGVTTVITTHPHTAMESRRSVSGPTYSGIPQLRHSTSGTGRHLSQRETFGFQIYDRTAICRLKGHMAEQAADRSGDRTEPCSYAHGVLLNHSVVNQLLLRQQGC